MEQLTHPIPTSSTVVVIVIYCCISATMFHISQKLLLSTHFNPIFLQAEDYTMSDPATYLTTSGGSEIKFIPWEFCLFSFNLKEKKFSSKHNFKRGEIFMGDIRDSCFYHSYEVVCFVWKPCLSLYNSLCGSWQSPSAPTIPNSVHFCHLGMFKKT